MALDASEVDLASLVLARNDVDLSGDWWFDPRAGTCLYYGIDDAEDLPELVDGVHVLVPRAPQPRDDVDDFIVALADDGADDDLLERLARGRRGKGALRRFREHVASTEAAEAWSRFTLARESARALHWLVARELVDPATVPAVVAALAADVPGGVGVVDPAP